MNTKTSQTIAATLWPAGDMTATARAMRFAALAIAGALALTLSAKAQVPFYPVPLTLQALVVLVLGACFGLRLSVASVGLYLLEGAAGLPVFAGTPEKGIGLLYMMGPTGGFLVGFLAAVAFIGYCADKGWDRSLFRQFAILSGGHVLLFAFGFVWLAHLIGAEKAYALGVATFLLASVVKTMLATAIVPGLWKLVGSLRG